MYVSRGRYDRSFASIRLNRLVPEGCLVRLSLDSLPRVRFATTAVCANHLGYTVNISAQLPRKAWGSEHTCSSLDWFLRVIELQ
jgi:hypothetical protein